MGTRVAWGAMRALLASLVLAAACTPPTAAEMEAMRAQQQRQAERQAALHQYCLHHPLECQQADDQRRAREDAIRQARIRAAFAPNPQPAYPTQAQTDCHRYGNSVSCTTRQR
jgi:hypothetical protein